MRLSYTEKGKTRSTGQLVLYIIISVNVKINIYSFNVENLITPQMFWINPSEHSLRPSCDQTIVLLIVFRSINRLGQISVSSSTSNMSQAKSSTSVMTYQSYTHPSNLLKPGTILFQVN